MYTPLNPPHTDCHKVSVLPPDAVPCDVKDRDNGWYILEHQPLTIPPTPQRSHYDLTSYINTQPEYLSQYYEMIDPLIPDNQFYDLLGQNTTIAIATDGGAKPKQGSIGFVIARDHNGERFFESYGQPAGIEPQSFRSEICSLLAAIRFLQLLVKYNDFLSNST